MTACMVEKALTGLETTKLGVIKLSMTACMVEKALTGLETRQLGSPTSQIKGLLLHGPLARQRLTVQKSLDSELLMTKHGENVRPKKLLFPSKQKQSLQRVKSADTSEIWTLTNCWKLYRPAAERGVA